jgi:putative transposase
MEKDEKEAKALFRYGLISEFLHADMARGIQSIRMQEIASVKYRVPWQDTPFEVSESTLNRWLSIYRRHGFSGLKPGDRSDKHISKVIDPILVDQIIAMKKADPDVSIPLLMASLEDSGAVPKGKLKHSTVHRLLQRHSLSGRPGRDRGIKPQRLPFRYSKPMALWVGDVMHSRHDVQGQKAYLIAWMDNATRAIMHAQYRFSESALDILTTFRKALEVRGICQRVYVDHGSGYVDGRFVRTCAHLGIHLMYAPVRDGAAKGCIERFFGTLRAGFERHLQPQDLTSLDSVNSMLWRWIHSTYHQKPHSGLDGQAPWHCFMRLLPEIEHRRIRTGFDFTALWKTRVIRRVHRDGTVRLKGHILEIPPTVTHTTVELRFMEEELPREVEVWEDEHNRGTAIPVDMEGNTRRHRWRPTSSRNTSGSLPVDPLTRTRKTWNKDNTEGGSL